MDQKLQITVSPHIRSSVTTGGIMLDVVIALCPALVAAVWLFGARALYITAICVLACVLSELIFQLVTKRTPSIGDLSAVVTGMLLAFNLPVSIPEWQAIVGSVVAIVIVKQLFGGIGCNFANPAITARIVLLLSFSQSMTYWTKPTGFSSGDLISSATPLAMAAEGTEKLPSLFDLVLGKHAGCMGETCALALLIGGVYLLIRRIITWHTPVAFIGTVFLISFFAGDFSLEAALYQILSGGLMLGAFFMATDYATSPPTGWGKLLFGIGCGIITAAIRLWGTYPEGVSFAILLMNILTPYITKLCARKVFGAVRAEKVQKT
ncbi:MAG: RnfABCDGE type electron transport complex subunit D [Clostridiales bacterium]|jgi:electron transport complex protein RnfD|nr:RnfABCDGE type electron transport complex subunit D [Clostridiales bacterium]